ncbi:MAG: phosphoenolpyruvate synthase [Lewinellaceae bacterium]|nr:phosphoenolpyruvate synthase [Lewinellaceae bacterium]
MHRIYIPLILVTTFFTNQIGAQPKSADAIKQMVLNYKKDVHGPYRDIRWFCKDGTIRQPRDPCPEPGGVQRARYKDEVIDLGKTNHLYLGQILATTGQEEFWDADFGESRIKQYILERYLREIDDGWVLRRAQYYRGAIQLEDEEAWGQEFLEWLVSDDQRLLDNYFLIRQAFRYLPHPGTDRVKEMIRVNSKLLSDSIPDFLDLRSKIHSQPEQSDIAKLQTFRTRNATKITVAQRDLLDKLIRDMQTLFQPVDLQSLAPLVRRIPASGIRHLLDEYMKQANSKDPARLSIATSDLLLAMRDSLSTLKKPSSRAALMDCSVQLEDLLFRSLIAWNPDNAFNNVDKICYATQAAAATGLLESWEWKVLAADLALSTQDTVMGLTELQARFERARAGLEWGANTIRATYRDPVATFATFEPIAEGFYDDRIRATVLLSLGQAVDKLGTLLSKEKPSNSYLFGLPGAEVARGLNPGIAFGELEIILDDAGEDLEVQKDKIYLFMRPPSDLKPVAGIATVSEGNLVSHVQLLARNLGIPNAVLPSQLMESLRPWQGKKIFYAVTPNGQVLMKDGADLTENEKVLVTTRQRSTERITVPTEKLQLGEHSVLNLRAVQATSSGKVCGPKAANLGQLKLLFPDQVVEGLVIPFGIFRQHMDQPLPGSRGSYWDYLQATFVRTEAMRQNGQQNATIETYALGRLDTLRKAIGKMNLLPGFISDLTRQFHQVLGVPIGKLPVFLRSDTNMEDLKDFTGAGLNLTLFNVLDSAQIMQGIRDVWASPYSERSFKWRQFYLLNPENVYPSILLIPGVDVRCSGVMITTGVTSGRSDELTVAFSRGAGGAVEGQWAESYRLMPGLRYQLLSPAREPKYRSLPLTGGTANHFASFANPILSIADLKALFSFASQVQQKLPGTPGIESAGPFDIELGFKEDKLWLFQVRPYVEQKNAVVTDYLHSLEAPLPQGTRINLNAND